MTTKHVSTDSIAWVRADCSAFPKPSVECRFEPIHFCRPSLRSALKLGPITTIKKYRRSTLEPSCPIPLVSLPTTEKVSEKMSSAQNIVCTTSTMFPTVVEGEMQFVGQRSVDLSHMILISPPKQYYGNDRIISDEPSGPGYLFTVSHYSSA